MLTGQRAFRRGPSAETLSAILNEEPPPLEQPVKNLPPALQRIVNRCLEKKPERRFQHVSDLGFALEALFDAGGTGVAAPREAAAQSWWTWVGAAAAILLAGALSVWWWRQPPAVPVVTTATQLTSDGGVKANSGRLETDGSRIYFGEGMVAISVCERK
ncbi:MAG TPA: hypothetical protein VIJ38_12365 [Acidobacteriaceae bacterium]